MKLNRILSLTLVLSLMLTTLLVFPAFADEPAVVASGTCGKNATWRLTDDGVVTISGTGTTTRGNWEQYYERVTKVVVEEGITSIASMAFNSYPMLREIVLPSSLKKIGSLAFAGSENLEIGDVPETCVCERGAFLNCDKFHPIKITKQPKNTSVNAVNDYATVTVKVEGEGLSYQWYYYNNTGTSYYSGGYTASTAASGKTDSYRSKVTFDRYNRYVFCRITDRFGRTQNTAKAWLKYKTAAVTITAQPASVTVKEGELAKIRVSAKSKYGDVRYRWFYKNAYQNKWHGSTNTTPTYSITMTEARDGRQMYCRIYDANGVFVESEVAVFYLDR